MRVEGLGFNVPVSVAPKVKNSMLFELLVLAQGAIGFKVQGSRFGVLGCLSLKV